MKRTYVLRSKLSSLLAVLATLFLVGCGSGSGEDPAVFTGADTSQVGQGAVVFNFVRAQNPLTVPTNTTTLDFQFYSEADGGGTVIQSETRNFAPTITINPVSGAARSVVVTARSTEGFPLVESTAAVAVVSGGEFVVSFPETGPTAVTETGFLLTPAVANVDASSTVQLAASVSFSNGEILPADNVNWSATGQANVDNNGLVTTLNNGAATVTATRNGQNAQSNLTVGSGPVLTTITVTPDAPTVALTSVTSFSATAVDQNGDPFALNNVTWSATPGTGTGDIVAGTGQFTATGVGTVTVTATQGAVSDDSVVTIVSNVPAVTLDMGTLGVSPTPVSISAGATVTDDQANLSGGTLAVRLVGAANDSTLTAPGAPAIGTVSGNNSNSLSVVLNGNATPANIATFLQGVTITAGMTNGMGTIQVDLSDGQGNSAPQATRAFSFSQELTTTFATNNGCAGNMFDVTTGGNAIQIDSFDIHLNGVPNQNMEVYYKSGTYAGFEGNQAAWTMLGSASVNGLGSGTPTPLPVGGLIIPANSTYGIYIIDRTGSDILYTNGAMNFTDGNITITTGAGDCGFFNAFNSRTWNGTLYYSFP